MVNKDTLSGAYDLMELKDCNEKDACSNATNCQHFHVTNEFKNGLGFLHGGSCAIIAEHVAAMHNDNNNNGNNSDIHRRKRYIKHMNIRYLSPMHVSVIMIN